MHALVEWRPPGCWELRDLGSQNGTFLDGERLVTGRWYTLAVGMQVGFGMSEGDWEVTSIERPQIEAVCISSGERRTTTEDILTLCEESSEWADVFEERPGTWVVERPGRQFAVRDGDEITAAGRVWRLVLPVASRQTDAFWGNPGEQEFVRFEFVVSQDLEHVELAICHGSARHTSERAHVRFLVELARALVENLEQGLSMEERGWVYSDDLCTRAGYEQETRLNVEVFRARRDFADFGIPNAANIIQRRRSTKQLRISPQVRCIVREQHRQT